MDNRSASGEAGCIAGLPDRWIIGKYNGTVRRLCEYDKSGGIYLSAWIADCDGKNLYTGNPWGNCDCCNAWVTGCGTGNWTYWQVSSTGRIGGVSGNCDFDAYNGTLAELEPWQGVQ